MRSLPPSVANDRHAPPAPAPSAMTTPPDPLAATARMLLRANELMADHVGGLPPADPARTLLLVLYLDQPDATPSGATEPGLSGVPATTIERWLRLLQAQGLVQWIVEEGRPHYLRVALTERARAAMRDYLCHVRALTDVRPPALPR